jgi:hypothetical protein
MQRQSIRRDYRWALLGSSLWIVFTTPLLATWQTDIGYDRLNSTFPSAPQAATAGVTQVEASLTAPPATYFPDTTHAEFTGKTFTNKSTGNVVPSSGHATGVGFNYYGGTASTLPAQTDIDVYLADEWLQTGFLGFNSSAAPSNEARQVENHSWIAPVDVNTTNFLVENIDQRLDYAVNQTGFIAVVGVNNGFSTQLPALLCQAYNMISVGLTNGQHSAGTTAYDGTGRIKPDLVVADSITSNATPRVSAAAGVLAQRAISAHSQTGVNVPRVVKALLLAGATKEEIPTWSRASTQNPLDARFGAGELNLLLSYRILESGQVAPSTTVSAPEIGWASSTLIGGTQQTYFFDVPAGSSNSRFSAALIWHRVVNDGTPGPNWSASPAALPNLKLELRNASGFVTGTLVDESNSAVDNVEHVYQPTLSPGRYAVVISSPIGTASTTYGLAWRTLPTVTVTASTATAAEQGLVPGQFTVSRTGSTATPLYVPLAISGNAIAGTDYTALPTGVLIPAGQASVTVAVTPLTDILAEGPETVTLTVSSDYSFSGGGAATVTLLDTPIDQWRFENFTTGELQIPAQGGRTGDFEGDGFSNILEYSLNGDPKNFLPSIAPVLGNDGTHLTLTFPRLADPGLIYAVWASTDLADWGIAPIWSSSGVQNVAGPVVVTDVATISSQPRRFLKLIVTAP